MRFDRQKAFPYPVLRPDVDDYLDGEFQVTVDFERGEKDDSITAKIHVALSIQEINQQIQKGNAAFVLIFACRDTFFRQPIVTNQTTFSRTFKSGVLRGEVIVSPFVVATKHISSFRCNDINKEFGQKKFTYQIGEVLAADEPKVIYIDRELFKPISSIFQLLKQDSLTGFDWKLSFEEQKIQILLSAEAKQAIDLARNNKAHTAVLINSIYFAAVMEAVQRLSADESTYEGHRWAKVIKQQCHNAGIDLESHESYWVAQRLLKTPLTLLNEYLFKDGDK